MARVEKVAADKTSTVQDLEAECTIELEALVGAVLEPGERLNLPRQFTRTLYSCVKLAEPSAPPSTAAK